MFDIATTIAPTKSQSNRNNESPKRYAKDDFFKFSFHDSSAAMPSGVMTKLVDFIRPKASLASSDASDERINSLHTRCSCKGRFWGDVIEAELMRSKTLMYVFNVIFEVCFWVVGISGCLFIGWLGRLLCRYLAP